MTKYINRLFNFIKYYFFKKKISYDKFIFNLKIDTNEIKYFLEFKNTLDRNNFIWDGDWDKKKIALSEYRNFSASFNSIFQIYEENQKYENCEEYKKKAELILSGKKTGRVENIYELKNYFKSLDQLRDNLKKFGYKSQQELKNDRKRYDEIGVVIDRDGEIIKLEDKYGGTHRFALCKVLKIKKIIVSVKAIHKSLLDENDLRKISTYNDNPRLVSLLQKKLKVNKP
jgi:hypothetical protein